jgi:hypothetical protein
VIGLKGSIGYSRSRNNGAGNYVSLSALNIGPAVFLKKYKKLKNRFGLYFNNELNVNYSMIKRNSPGPDYLKTHGWVFNYNFNPGVFYKFSDNFLGEATIGGLYASYYKAQYDKSFSIGASFLQTFNLGVNYIIRKRSW